VAGIEQYDCRAVCRYPECFVHWFFSDEADRIPVMDAVCMYYVACGLFICSEHNMEGINTITDASFQLV
jgi:hypothetical protein